MWRTPKPWFPWAALLGPADRSAHRRESCLGPDLSRGGGIACRLVRTAGRGFAKSTGCRSRESALTGRHTKGPRQNEAAVRVGPKQSAARSGAEVHDRLQNGRVRICKTRECSFEFSGPYVARRFLGGMPSFSEPVRPSSRPQTSDPCCSDGLSPSHRKGRP